MKKFLIILCSVFLLTGCSEKTESTSEIIPESTAEVSTETSDVYEQQTYREVLENMCYNYEFPDWDYKNCTDVSIEFAVYDIDGDGREELLVTFDNRGLYMYDHNADGNLVRQFSGYIRSDFYENGAVKVYSAHNQTHSLEVHPFEMYRYNADTDSYDQCGSVRGVDKDVVDMINKEKEEVGRTDFLEYPSEYDTSSSGTVYYIRSRNNTTDIPMGEAEYNEYYSQFTENTGIIDIPFMELTKENIKKVSGNSLNVIKISDNITFYDLTVPENAEYRPKNRVVGMSYDMSGYGTIREQDGNIYLESTSGRTALIELPVESETVYVVISCIIDDSRFAYSIIQEDAGLGCGVYNLENGEDFRIESKDRCHYFPQYIAGDYLILKRGFIADIYGYSRLNLDTLELTDIVSEYIPQEQRIPSVAFSPDGKTGAVYSGQNKNGEYVITLFSLDDDTKVAEYKFSSENEYTSFSLEFVSKYELYVYPYKEVIAGSDYLYKIHVPPIPVLNDWQKAYKQALFDFMDSDDYFTGSDIIEPSAFSLYDLNTDGTPELIISENTSHAAGCHIYTYDDGLIYLGKRGAYGDIGYYEDNGTIYVYNIGQGIEHEIFSRFENNEINMIAKFYNDVWYFGEDGVFEFNDTEVTEDEYNAKLAEYRGTEYVSLGRDYSFDEMYTSFNEYSRIISVSRASELLWLNLPESDNRHISYYNRQKFDYRTYYVFRCYEDYDDRRVTTGWYAVDIFTGDCYNTNALTELTPLINEEKKFSCKVTESGGVEIYSDGEFYQSLDVEIDDTFLNYESNDLLKFRDYDFDGYNDIAVNTALATNAVYSYFRYNPDTEYFENWEELNNLHFYIQINDDNTLSVHSKSGAVDADDTVYKWSDDVLVPVSTEKRYWNSEGIFMDYLEYDENGNETLVKREKLVYDNDGSLISATEIEPTYTEISENIKLYDLKKHENSELIPAEETIYSKDIEMAGYGILSNSDGNIKLVKDNGEENIIVESPYPDNAYSWVRTEFPIDNDRFVYSACGEWGNRGFGVYDLKSGENHIVMESYYPKAVRGNSLILSKAKYSGTVTAGYSEFDLDSYEIRDIPLQIDLENLKYYKTNSVSADGRFSAVMKYEDDSYIITVISLESGEVAEEYILETADKYGNVELEFVSADELHLYAKRFEDNTYHLYVFDIA